jgi:hypothetical protein
MTSFRAFLNARFAFIAERIKRLKDGRKHPRIAMDSMFFSLFYGGLLGLGSLLGIDQFMRTEAAKRLFGTSTPLVSDSTLSRFLWAISLSPLHDLLLGVYKSARSLGPSRLPVGLERLRVGMIDGSCFGRFRASCFAQIGTICLMADLEPIKKMGKELSASARLVKRLSKRLGKRFVDLILLDALYMAQNFIQVCLDSGIDVLIKTREETLDIIQDAKALLLSEHAQAFGVVIVKGLDKTRQRTYEIRALCGLFYQRVSAPFKLAYVKEQEIKTGKTHAFWVLTTMSELTENQMRELAHGRFDEENNGFKALNHLVHTKHLYAHKNKAQQAMLFILMIAQNLLQLFQSSIKPEAIIELLGPVKRTRRLIQQLLRQSLMTLPDPDT